MSTERERDRVVSRAEYRARKWAARYLMPRDKLLNALRRDIVEVWDLSDCFEVDEELVRLRLEMLKAELAVRQFKREGDFIEFGHNHPANRLRSVDL